MNTKHRYINYKYDLINAIDNEINKTNKKAY